MNAPHSGGPRLLADIGGTNARFALERAPGLITDLQVLACAAHDTAESAIRAYLAAVGSPAVRHAAIAIANPVDGDAVRMTNHHWQFSIEALRAALGLTTFRVLNDFTALALSLRHLRDDERVAIGGGERRAEAAIGLVGPGTGLGVSGLIPSGDGRWTPLASEGGHSTFSPATATERAILEFAQREFAHVSSERLISGPGLVLIHRALCTLRGEAVEPLTPADIARRAQSGECPRCRDTATVFSGMLGTFAGNLAVTLGALGGVYLGGGVIGGLGSAFDRGEFRRRFEAKGRFEAYLRGIATVEITAEQPALRGVAAALAAQLDGPRA